MQILTLNLDNIIKFIEVNRIEIENRESICSIDK